MFGVGQTVWDVVRGEGVVDAIESETPYPLVVKFADGGGCTYRMDGKSLVSYKNRSLYPYPVEVVKKVVKPSINWEHVRGNYNYLATDDMGNAWLYGKEPTIDDDNGCWDVELGEFALADTHVSYAPGTCDWKESLVKRPEGDNHGG